MRRKQLYHHLCAGIALGLTLLPLHSQAVGECDAGQCQYTVELDQPGFYITEAYLRNATQSGFWNLSTTLDVSPTLTSLHTGNEVTGYTAFSLSSDTTITLGAVDYTGLNDRLSVQVYQLGEETTLAHQEIINSGTTITTPELTAGFYAAVMERPRQSDGFFSLDVIAPGLRSESHTGGLLRNDRGLGYAAFFVEEPQTMRLTTQFGQTYGDTDGATRPVIRVYRLEEGEKVPVMSPTILRFATFNAALNRNEEGQLITDLSTPDNSQARNVAEIIQRANPDVLALQEFDYDAEGQALQLFQDNYLSVSQNDAEPVTYPYTYVVPSNTGVPSGVDFDGNGEISGGNDAFGFGNFPGQYAFALLSKYPIQTEQIRTFQNFLWRDMPNAKLPVNPTTSDSYYSEAALDIFRLSSKNHVDVPITLPTGVVHVLIAHPTPPVFDGDEDRNGLRNHDEIRLFADYVSGEASYLYDDAGTTGGLASDAHFVIMGDMNADPVDGDSTDEAILQLLNNSRVNPDATQGFLAPRSRGGEENNQSEGDISNPAFDTAGWGLRVDYVLPSAELNVLASGVYWPASDEPYNALVEFADGENASSDHRLVWVDLVLPE